MKTGICQTCHKEFKLTKLGKLYRHGYKQEIYYKRWSGYFGIFTRAYYKLTKLQCMGSGLMPTVQKKKEKNMNFLMEIKQECERASKKFPKFHSTHEGYAIILEELDELWTEIKGNTDPTGNMKKEAIQVGAMALRFLIDCCNEEPIKCNCGEDADFVPEHDICIGCGKPYRDDKL